MSSLELTDPKVTDYIDKVRDKERREKHSKPGVGLTAMALLGAGYGVHALGDKVVSPEGRKALEDVANMADRAKLMRAQHPGELPPDAGMFYDYLDRASLAAATPIYGVPAADRIIALRKGPLGELLGEKIGDQLNEKTRSSLEHYGNFKQGPVPAMWHQLSKFSEAEPTEADNVTNWLFGKPEDKANYKALLDKLQTQVKADPKVVAKWDADSAKLHTLRESLPMGEARIGHHELPALGDTTDPGFKDRLAAYASALFQKQKEDSPDMTSGKFTKGFHNLFRRYFEDKTGLAGVDPSDAEAVGKHLTHGQQMDLVRGFQGWADAHDPAYAKMFDTTLQKIAPTQLGPVENYAHYGRPALQLLQDVPHAVGYGLGGLGAGLGAYWLYNLLKPEKKIRSPKLEVVKKEASNMPDAQLHPFDLEVAERFYEKAAAAGMTADQATDMMFVVLAQQPDIQ